MCRCTLKSGGKYRRAGACYKVRCPMFKSPASSCRPCLHLLRFNRIDAYLSGLTISIDVWFSLVLYGDILYHTSSHLTYRCICYRTCHRTCPYHTVLAYTVPYLQCPLTDTEVRVLVVESGTLLEITADFVLSAGKVAIALARCQKNLRYTTRPGLTQVYIRFIALYRQSRSCFSNTRIC